MSTELTRRRFLTRAALLGGVAAASTVFPDSRQANAQDAPEQPADPAADACSDVSGLTELEATTRGAIQYVDVTTDPAKRCDGCMLYQAGVDGGCPTCQLNIGPVLAGGGCISWVATPT